MRAFKLKRVTLPPPPPERLPCEACKGFRADIRAQVGDALVPLCWVCAHHVVEHGTSVLKAAAAGCQCLPWQIYPDRPTFEHADAEFTKPCTAEDWLRESALSEAARELMKQVIGNMSPEQRALLLSGMTPSKGSK